MEVSKVRIVNSEMVKPARCLENPPKLKPTAFDMLMEKIPYQQRILFYKFPDKTPYEEILQLLRRSLAEALVVFYPLAGRVSTDENGGSVIDCGSGRSVKFVQAVTDSTLEELGEFQPCEFCDGLCCMGDSTMPQYPWTPEDPLLLIQVTRFSCGGLSLGFAFNHHVVDGTSAWHFMTSWAEVARTGSLKNPPEITYSFQVPQLTPEQLVEQADKLTFSDKPGSSSQFDLATKVFHLETSMIQRLKDDAAAATDGKRFSSFVVISAYFWRIVTLARQLPQSETTRYLTAVNCRRRILSLSKWYFGNAVSGFAIKLNSGEIDDPNWLSRCTTFLHERISACSSERGLSESVACFSWIASRPEEWRRLDFSRNVVQAIGSPHHPVYESDFGFGKPAGVTFGSGELGDGKLYLFPSARGNGGVTATLVLPSDVMNRLEQLYIKQFNI